MDKLETKRQGQYIIKIHSTNCLMFFFFSHIIIIAVTLNSLSFYYIAIITIIFNVLPIINCFLDIVLFQCHLLHMLLILSKTFFVGP